MGYTRKVVTFKGPEAANYARIHNLLLMVVSLLEHMPNVSSWDEHPAVSWLETMDRITKELIGALGKQDGITRALGLFQQLNARESEAVEFARGNDLESQAIVWHAIFDYAKWAARSLKDNQFAAEKTRDQVAELERRLETEQFLRREAERQAAEARSEAVASLVPGRMDKKTGIKIIDVGD